jgi:hypothetical protein
MSSISLHKLFDRETEDAIFAAVQTVAERSFFAMAERTSERSFGELAPTTSGWLIATVRFEDGSWIGTMSCTLPEDLAAALFNGFTGRDPSAPTPEPSLLYDLVGEFSNMVCGAWLSRCAGGWAFTLGSPIVTTRIQPADADGFRLFLVVGDQPLLVDLEVPSQAGDDRGPAATCGSGCPGA